MPLTDKLLWLTDAPPYLICFVPVVDRLAQLLERYPQHFKGLQLPTSGSIRAWSDAARNEISSWPDKYHELGRHLNKSGIEASRRASGYQHPLMGFGFTFWGTYSILLITKDELSDQQDLVEGFDQTVAACLAIALKYNIEEGYESYLKMVFQVDDFTIANADMSDNRKRVVVASKGIFRLQQLIGPPKKFLLLANPKITCTALADAFDDWIDELKRRRSPGEDGAEHIQTSTFLSGIYKLLIEKPLHKRKATDSESEAELTDRKALEQEHDTENKKAEYIRSLPLMQSLLAGGHTTYLPSMPIEFQDLISELDEQVELDEQADPLFHAPTPEDFKTADDFDIAIEELLEPLPYDAHQLDYQEQEQDEDTLKATTINEVDFRKRLAERQLTRVSNVGLDARVALANFLQCEIQRTDAYGAAARIIATSWVTGRQLSNILTQHFLPETEGHWGNTNFIVDFIDDLMILRVHRPKAYPINSPSAYQVSDQISLPDVLGIGEAICFQGILDKNEFDGQLSKTLRELLAKIDSLFEITLSQLQNMLAETMIAIEGNGCTAVLITDISDKSLKINRHYLTPRAKTVAQAYTNAVCQMLGHKPFLVENAYYENRGHHKYVGMHMCPHIETVTSTIKQLHSYHPIPTHWRLAHNQITLATVMLLAFAIGARDALAFNPNGFEVINGNAMCHYLEKGEMRVICLPPQLALQLKSYDEHMIVLQELWFAETKRKEIHSDLFFLFDSSGFPSKLHPKSLPEYLLEFGIDYDTPLNGLRRMLFTELYETRHFGSELDVFIGHGSLGRRPWDELSGMRVASISIVADQIRQLLIDHGWPLFKGCGYVP